MFIAWLTTRIAKLYAVNAPEIAEDVLAAEKDIFARAKELFFAAGAQKGAGSLAGDLANIHIALTQALSEATGLASDAGRVARMELMHTAEGLRHLVGLMDPDLFQQIAGPTIVPVTTPPVVFASSNQQSMPAPLATTGTSTGTPNYPVPPPAPVGTPMAPLVVPPVVVVPDTPVTPPSNEEAMVPGELPTEGPVTTPAEPTPVPAEANPAPEPTPEATDGQPIMGGALAGGGTTL